MNGNEDKRIVSFPGSGEHSAEAREARVRALKKRIANGEYRLEAGAIAEAMLEQGVFAAESSGVTASDVSDADGMRRAMDHFVVRAEPAEDTGTATESATGS